MIAHNNLTLFFYFLCLQFLSASSNDNPLASLVTKYEAIVENILMDNEGKLKAKKEISTNKQILIMPTQSVMSSEEDYQFKEYFSHSNKEKLVGRLLIERFVGNSSYYFEFINTLPKPEEMMDYYHFSDSNKEELNKRSYVKFYFADRKSAYENLIRKVPTNTIPSLLLNWELYNWASSVVDCYGIQMKKKYAGEVKRLSKLADLTPSEEVGLIPGLNLFQNGPFKSLSGNNIQTSIFAYKEHIYLNSDRFIDEGEEIFNEIQFQPSVKLYEMCGKFVPGFIHEEMHMNVTNKEWTLKKFNLCKDIECLPKTPGAPHFVFKYEFNHQFLTYCQIDQLENNDDPKHALRTLKANRKINDVNYMKALSKCSQLIKAFIKSGKKTNIVQDINDLANGGYIDERDQTIIRFSLSQKKILYNQVKLLNNRLIRELQREIFSTLKNQYI